MTSHDHDTSTITRRDFLKGAAYGALGLAMGVGSARSEAVAKAKPLTKVVVVRGPGVLDAEGKVNRQILDQMLDKGMRELSGLKSVDAAWKKYIRADDAVGIKINRMMTPTHEDLTAAISERLARIGVTKSEAWDRDAGKPEGFTALINVPGMKSHWLSGVAFSIKNYAGCHPEPSRYHADSCADLAAMWEHPTLKGKTRLIIVDGLKMLYNGGPQVDPRYLLDYEALVMGTDPVAVDTVCLSVLQKKRNEVQPPEWILNPPPKHIEVADKKYGLGTSHLNKIKLVNIKV
ncbi:MAG: DUF362 domain-containing protein [Armatimonadota bacterium]|nr:DUF362 domain-containing protein [Armatimonadota bacterium]